MEKMPKSHQPILYRVVQKYNMISSIFKLACDRIMLAAYWMPKINFKGPWPLSHDNISQVWPISKYSKTL